MLKEQYTPPEQIQEEPASSIKPIQSIVRDRVLSRLEYFRVTVYSDRVDELVMTLSDIIIAIRTNNPGDRDWQALSDQKISANRNLLRTISVYLGQSNTIKGKKSLLTAEEWDRFWRWTKIEKQ